MSELKCCKLCGAFHTCDHKGECCPECEHYDPLDNLCMASHLKKKAKRNAKSEERDEEVDPDTFLFDDDDDDEDDESDLPPERELDEDDGIPDDDWD